MFCVNQTATCRWRPVGAQPPAAAPGRIPIETLLRQPARPPALLLLLRPSVVLWPPALPRRVPHRRKELPHARLGSPLRPLGRAAALRRLRRPRHVLPHLDSKTHAAERIARRARVNDDMRRGRKRMMRDPLLRTMSVGAIARLLERAHSHEGCGYFRVPKGELDRQPGRVHACKRTQQNE